MNLEEVLNYLNEKMPDNVVVSIFQPEKDFVVFIAPSKKSSFMGNEAPNAYVMTKNKKIVPINPIQDPKKFKELTDKKFLIYSRYGF